MGASFVKRHFPIFVKHIVLLFTLYIKAIFRYPLLPDDHPLVIKFHLLSRKWYPQGHSLSKPRPLCIWVDERVHKELSRFLIHQLSTPCHPFWGAATRPKTPAVFINQINSSLLNAGTTNYEEEIISYRHVFKRKIDEYNRLVLSLFSFFYFFCSFWH